MLQIKMQNVYFYWVLLSLYLLNVSCGFESILVSVQQLSTSRKSTFHRFFFKQNSSSLVKYSRTSLNFSFSFFFSSKKYSTQNDATTMFYWKDCMFRISCNSFYPLIVFCMWNKKLYFGLMQLAIFLSTFYTSLSYTL